MITERVKPVELEEAVRLINSHIEQITETEICCVDDVRGRITAETVIASHDQPPFPRSPFDGYAVKSEDTSGADRENAVTLKVIGEVDAGGWFEETVSAGGAVRIMTGAPIPSGADAVIKQEETDYGEDTVQIFREMIDHQNYIPPGEDYNKGDILLEKGEYIGPVEAGIIASTGLPEIMVYRRPKAVVISTGDELRYPGEELTPGKIYDSNMYTIRAQLEEWGVEVISCFHMPDEPEGAAEALKKWADKADIIVTSGGVSVGKKDIMHDVFSILGIERILWKVGIKPGAAVLAGRYGETMILALSGNPYASYVDLHMIVRPALSALTGCDRLEMIRTKAILASDYDRKSPRRRFVRANFKHGKAYIEGHTGGNGDITSGRHINAMIDIPAGSEELKAGDEVDVILI